MNRILIVLCVSLLAASVVSAACVPASSFSPSFAQSSINLPEFIASAAVGSPLDLDLNPDSAVENFTVTSIRATSNADLRITLIPEDLGDGSYRLTPRFRMGPSLTLDSLRSATFDFEADITYKLQGETTINRQTICLGSLDTSIRGSISEVESLVNDLRRDLEDIDSIFDVIDVLLTVARIGTEYECRTASDRYDVLDTLFTENCASWSDALTQIILHDADVSVACDADPNCMANMTGALGAANCPVLYGNLLEAEMNASSVCSRNECKPVLTLDDHTASYTDPLGISRCSDADLDDEACRAEFERVQSPYCPGVDVVELGIAGAQEPLTLSLSDICLDAADEPVSLLKDPAGDILSSVQCMCLPAMQGYVRQVERMYDYASECLFSSEDNSSRDCKNATYRFLCDMAVGSALQCGGLGYQEFSGSARTYVDASGNPVDFSDPDAAADAIAQGGVFVVEGSGDLGIDTTRLAHAVCESALGDADIDWASILDPDVSTDGSMSRLCAPGVKLTSPCVCDLSATGAAQMCGTSALGNRCTFDASEREAVCDTHDDGDPDQQAYEEAVRRMQDQWRSNWQSARRTVTSLPAGAHGQPSGIIGCIEHSGFTEVKQRAPSGEQRTLVFKSGYIVLPHDGSNGLVAERIFSCSGSELVIEINPTSITT